MSEALKISPIPPVDPSALWKDPVFTPGQEAICCHADGYPFVEGGHYIIEEYEPRTPTDGGFVWPAYVGVRVDGKLRMCHASRFRAIPPPDAATKEAEPVPPPAPVALHLKRTSDSLPKPHQWCLMMDRDGDYDTGFHDGAVWWDDDGTEMSNIPDIVAYIELPYSPGAAGWKFELGRTDPPAPGFYLCFGPGVGNHTDSPWTVRKFDPADKEYGPWLCMGGNPALMWAPLPTLPPQS